MSQVTKMEKYWQMEEQKECKHLVQQMEMAEEQVEIKMLQQQMVCKQRVFQMVTFHFLYQSF
jgi:hypothetical protein